PGVGRGGALQRFFGLELNIQPRGAQSAAQCLQPLLARTKNRHVAPGLRAQFLRARLLEPFAKLARFFDRSSSIRDFPGWIWSEICGLQVDSNNLAGQNLRPRIEFDKRDLLITVVQDLAKRFIQEPELRLIEPKRDGEFQRVCRAGLDQRVMNASILREISAV